MAISNLRGITRTPQIIAPILLFYYLWESCVKTVNTRIDHSAIAERKIGDDIVIRRNLASFEKSTHTFLYGDFWQKLIGKGDTLNGS